MLNFKTLILFFTIIFCFGIVGCSSNEQTKPNIIIFFTDDQGYADVGSFGAKGFETPNIDGLAKEGIRFTNFYVPATVCTPSRAALLTGKYPKRVGLHDGVISPYSTNGLAPEEFTMAEMLKEQGYSTSIIGKWHLGHEEKFMPNNQGFDSYYGVPYSNDMDNHFYQHNNFQSPPLPFYRDKIKIAEGLDQDQLTKMFTEEAISQINKESDDPFFMYVAHCMPHVPLHASKKFKGKSNLGIYGDVIMELDWSMGEIIKALKLTGKYENTIIVFTSDNGPHKGSAYPLRGMKAQTWEGGQRVPGIISWPLKIPKNKISNEVVSTLDLFPTLAAISNILLNKESKLDGLDISNHLLNPLVNTIEERPFYYFARNGEIEAVRFGKWKLHISKSIGWDFESNGDFPISLYNLDNDVREEINLANQFPNIVLKLKNMILNFEKSL